MTTSRSGSILIATVCAIAFSTQATAGLEQGTTLEKDVPTGPTGEYIDLFPTTKIYSGQKIRLQISGQIDVNHRYWEERKCNWFGAHCWYEDREAPSWYSTDTFPVVFRLVGPNDSNLLSSPVQTSDNSLAGGTERHIGITGDQLQSPQTIVIDVRTTSASKDINSFGTGTTLLGKIVDVSTGGVTMNLATCAGRNPCSAGSYRVRLVDIDNSNRIADLRTILGSANPPDPGAILPALDTLFTRDPAVRQKIAQVLFEHAKKRYQADQDAGSADLIQFLEFAAQLDVQKGVNEIGNALATAYLKSGNVAQAKATAQANNPILARQFNDNPSDTTARTNYLQNIRLIAATQVRERSGLYTSDLIKAVSLYIQASALGEKGGDDQSKPAEVRRELYTLGYESLVDAMRTLMMARTLDNIIRAETLSDRAIVIAKRAFALK